MRACLCQFTEFTCKFIGSSKSLDPFLFQIDFYRNWNRLQFSSKKRTPMEHTWIPLSVQIVPVKFPRCSFGPFSLTASRIFPPANFAPDFTIWSPRIGHLSLLCQSDPTRPCRPGFSLFKFHPVPQKKFPLPSGCCQGGRRGQRVCESLSTISFPTTQQLGAFFLPPNLSRTKAPDPPSPLPRTHPPLIPGSALSTPPGRPALSPLIQPYPLPPLFPRILPGTRPCFPAPPAGSG